MSECTETAWGIVEILNNGHAQLVRSTLSATKKDAIRKVLKLTDSFYCPQCKKERNLRAVKVGITYEV